MMYRRCISRASLSDPESCFIPSGQAAAHNPNQTHPFYARASISWVPSLQLTPRLRRRYLAYTRINHQYGGA